MHSLEGKGIAELLAFYARYGARTGATTMTAEECQMILLKRNTISTAIVDVTKEIVADLATELTAAALKYGMAFTVDGWQDRHLCNHYLVVTAHYASVISDRTKKGKTIVRMAERCLGLEHMDNDESRTGEYILTCV